MYVKSIRDVVIMQILKRISLVICLLVPVASQATNTWSSTCQTVKAVSNQIANSVTPAIFVYISPGLTGCGTGSYSYVSFQIGINGVTSTNINSILASALTAAATGKGITVYYDPSTSYCYAENLDYGGNSVTGYCP